MKENEDRVSLKSEMNESRSTKHNDILFFPFCCFWVLYCISNMIYTYLNFNNAMNHTMLCEPHKSDWWCGLVTHTEENGDAQVFMLFLN